MSNSSKFYQVTNFILLEYKTDQYSALNHKDTPENERPKIYMYRTLTGKQACLDMSNFEYTSFPDGISNDFYFPGFAKYGNNEGKKLNINENNDNIVFNNTKYNNGIVGTIIRDADNNLERNSTCLRDTVRIYFSTGYFMNAIQGLTIKVEAPVSEVRLETTIPNDIPDSYKPFERLRVKDNITLLEFYLPKTKLVDLTKRLPSALYFNSKFYDRYIELTFPAPYDLGNHGGDKNIDYIHNVIYNNPITNENIELTYRGYVNINAPSIISFATIQNDFVTYINESNIELLYSPDAATKVPITYDSNSKYFNVELYEDSESGTIVYQPVYGEPSWNSKMQPFDLTLMNKIESGIIHMYDIADADLLNDGINDFIELYGDDTYKWCIINELSVTYYYDYIIESDRENAPTIQPYTEYYTNTIDYTGKTFAHGEFWKSKFLPYIQERPLMTCTKIGIVYTAHLYNRMNNREITRTASIIINNPMKYGRAVINTASINSYKVINKIVQNISTPQISNNQNNIITEKYIPSRFVALTDLIVKLNDNTSYTQNGGTLELYKGPQQYMFQFYELDKSGGSSRIPYNLSEPGIQYKLTFPLAKKGEKLEFTAIDYSNDNSDLIMGKLLFFISGDEADKIMGFTGDHIFRITALKPNSNTPEVTLYTGNVKWNYT